MTTKVGQGRKRLNYNYQDGTPLDDVGEDEDLTPEQRLFKAVIDIHMIDAIGQGIALSGDERRRQQKISTSWILHSRDFEDYCDFVGIDPYKIRLRLKSYIKNTMQ